MPAEGPCVHWKYEGDKVFGQASLNLQLLGYFLVDIILTMKGDNPHSAVACNAHFSDLGIIIFG